MFDSKSSYYVALIFLSFYFLPNLRKFYYKKVCKNSYRDPYCQSEWNASLEPSVLSPAPERPTINTGAETIPGLKPLKQ
jgi:hypothetical protein